MDIFTGVIILALLGTIVTLGMGLSSMAHGGEYDKEHSEQFMFARIGMQGVTLLLLVVAALVAYFMQAVCNDSFKKGGQNTVVSNISGICVLTQHIFLVSEQYNQEPEKVVSIVMLANLGRLVVMPFSLAIALN